LLNSDFLNDPNQVLTPIIFFTLVPWAIGWSYGFILIINIKGRQALFDTARTDVLTGLNPNKGKSLCLSVLDVNGFKHLNDKYGHLFGDEVLRHIGKVIREQLTDGDSAIRYGGDEFILLLTYPTSGNNPAQKLQQMVETATEPTTIESVALNLPISFGNAHYPEDGTTGDELFKVADYRMYEQKRAAMQ
jgi:diguanylate cyclase (GGDEF)-like protein